MTEIEGNDIGEIVHVSICKANGEVIRCHVTDVIFLQRNPTQEESVPEVPTQVRAQSRASLKRKAADECVAKLSLLRQSGAI